MNVRTLLQTESPPVNGNGNGTSPSLDPLALTHARAIRLREDLREAFSDPAISRIDRALIFAAYVSVMGVLGEVVDPLAILLENGTPRRMGVMLRNHEHPKPTETELATAQPGEAAKVRE